MLDNDITADNLVSQNLLRLFGLVAEQNNTVVWIRTPDYRQQLYLSPAFEKIWGRSVESIFQSPLAWSQSLVDDEKAIKIRELCARNPLSHSRQRNASYYRIYHFPTDEIRYIEDTCFYLADTKGAIIAIAGVAKQISEQEFEAKITELASNDSMMSQEEIIYNILEKQSNEPILFDSHTKDELSKHYVFMRDGSYVPLTKREYETLRELIKGKSNKEIAKILSLSPRTIDDYVESIKSKFSFQKKAELFKKIHPLYLELFLV